MNLPGVYPIFLEKWKDLQTAFILSDTHFGDKELQKGIPNRLSDEEFVKKINSKVGKKDLLILLGDVGNIEVAKKLRGYKILIMGNHDAGRTNYEEIFNEVYAGPLIIADRLILSHEPITGIDWAFNIHGHVHDPRSKNDNFHFNVCADIIDYSPINLNQWMKEGYLAKIQSIHRETINKATKRKSKRPF